MGYSSAFAPFIEGLIVQKRAMGYKYMTEVGLLRRFDAFCLERFPDETSLTRDVVFEWATRRPGEHPATLQGRVSPVKELARYMARMEIDAYILPRRMMPKVPRYMPYIYSDDELRRIFEQTDRCCYCPGVPHRHLVMPVFFRLLYGSGMRLSEARLLKVCDVDLLEGVITVTNAKLGKHRQLPVSPEMLARLSAYGKALHAASRPDGWFFPGRGGLPMTVGNVEKNLRRFLWQAKISHGGRGRGPRVHDLRHVFAVHCLRKWVLEGKELRAYLPVLQAYLGHTSLSDTVYYLHLTADLFPDIAERTERFLGDVIPRLGGGDENV